MMARLRTFGLWVALVGVLAWAFRNPHQSLSPGHLIPAHRMLDGKCLACHLLGKGVPVARCAACHPVETIGRITSTGVSIVRPLAKAAFHRRLRQLNCSTCHSEHVGFAGETVRGRFTHAMLDPLSRRDCASCHDQPADAMHRGFGAQCGSCHGVRAWKPAAFDHQKFFPLDQAHTVMCATCHPGPSFKQYTCYGCHEHSRSRMQSKHAEEGIRDLDTCVRCHKSPSDRGEGGRERGDGEEREGR